MGKLPPLLLSCAAGILLWSTGCQRAVDQKTEQAAIPPLPVWQDAPADFQGKFIWGITADNVKSSTLPELRALPNILEGDPTVMKIGFITPGGTGEAEGLRSGDIILQIDGRPAGDFIVNNAISQVSGSRSGQAAPGDQVSMKVYRQRDGQPKVETLTVTYRRYHQTERIPYVESATAAEFAGIVPEFWQQTAPLLYRKLPEADLNDLLQRLVNMDVYSDPYRLPLFRYLARNPFQTETVARHFAERLEQAAATPAALITEAQYLLNFAQIFPAETPAAFPGGDLTAHLDEIEKTLKRCAELNQKAFANITLTDRDFVLSHQDGLLNSLLRYHMLSYEPITSITTDNLKLLAIMNKIDYVPLFEQARLAARLTEPEFVASLVQATQPQANQAIVAIRDTPYGKIVIAGTGNNIHIEDCAVLIDLGGDDLYLNNQGASIPGKISTSVFIDHAGNDSYESTDRLTQGAGNFGVGILADLAGDDQYIGIDSVQGAAFGGMGLLIDSSGNDTYRAMYFAQGSSFFGAGTLLDRSGNDRYEGHQYTQAVGFTKGAGLLLDLAGNDQYYCKGSRQTSYKTRGHFEGWGQGCGSGLRPYASGGIGILCDYLGNDRFEGGTFTQGGGYYYAFGMLYNGGNDNDLYVGTRYAQGFAAHQAIGVFIEAGGDDHYLSRHCVAQGLSWDETIVVFSDDSGNDIYDAGFGGFSQSAAAQNGLCLFRDRSGRDIYRPAQAATAGGNNYHGGTSLAIFLDDGGEDDQYVKRGNNTVESGPANYLFIDR